MIMLCKDVSFIYLWAVPYIEFSKSGAFQKKLIKRNAVRNIERSQSAAFQKVQAPELGASGEVYRFELRTICRYFTYFGVAGKIERSNARIGYSDKLQKLILAYVHRSNA